ncbi:MAG: tripartite tricarboxylate transporter substrate binding protein [Hyphomicrobiales bacterium]|nr:tripartite tricarboxylate transporter substrate binding protein [Hyphomicrobiales bacterium]
MGMSRRRLLGLAAAAVIGAPPSSVLAQSYPTKPVRVIVPFAPGGTTDIFARLAAQKLGDRLGKQFYVENVAGASGNIATGQAARAAPDGYTLLFAFSSHVVNPSLFERIPYDPEKDFDPVTLAVSSTAVLSVNPSVPARTVKELVDVIRANPGKYNFASPGAGTQAHLAGEQFRMSLGLDIVHVPYNGAGPSVASVVAGHTPIGFSTLASAGPHIRAGTLRPLAVTAKTRSQIAPDVPTMTEAGYPDIEGDSWVSVLVPAGTPKDIVALLHREIVALMALPETKERLVTLGFDTVASTPEELGARIRAEIALWGRVIRAGNIKPP